MPTSRAIETESPEIDAKSWNAAIESAATLASQLWGKDGDTINARQHCEAIAECIRRRKIADEDCGECSASASSRLPSEGVADEVANRVAGHIRNPYSLVQIMQIIDAGEYNAELMLQHLLRWIVANDGVRVANGGPAK